MWSLRRNKVQIRKEPKPKLRDVWVSLKIMRSHVAGIHSNQSSLVNANLAHSAHLADLRGALDDLAKVVKRLERQSRPVEVVPEHLQPDAQGRGPDHVDYNLPAGTDGS